MKPFQGIPVKLIASQELRRDRIMTCKSCPSKHPTKNKCTECGCSLKAKILFEGAKCPLDRWEK